jgi:hypothetical protein
MPGKSVFLKTSLLKLAVVDLCAVHNGQVTWLFSDAQDLLEPLPFQ